MCKSLCNFLCRSTLPATQQLAVLLLAVVAIPHGATWSQTRWDANDTRNRGFATNDTASQLWQGSNWLEQGTASQGPQWVLGVRGENTDVGVVIREVVRGSAADRARIEVGDIIVNVDGFQVGLVNGRLYDIAEEINRRADNSGTVNLVIQDHRNFGLASVRVKLDDNQQQTLRGSLVYNDRSPLPNDAIVTVQIENVTRPHYKVRQGQTSFRPTPGRDIPFEIAYDPTYINAQDTYQVSAFVTSGGRPILETPQPRTVLTRGNPSEVQMQLATLTRNVSSGGNTVSAGYSPNYSVVDQQLVAMFRKYLGRSPSPLELVALHATPGIEDKLRTMPIELMAAQEYFDAAGNNNQVWLDKVFTQIVQRQPTPSELQQWMDRYQQLRFSRTDLLRQLYSVIR